MPSVPADAPPVQPETPQELCSRRRLSSTELSRLPTGLAVKMDPLTILSLAATIVQFVDFGHTLLSGAKEVYDSVDGVLKSTDELGVLLEDVQSTTNGIKNSPLANALSPDERHLLSLARSCENIAAALRQKLKRLKARKDARFKIVESARVSFEAIFQQKDIKQLDERLGRVYSQLQSRLAAITQE
jgi:hypothetical protein